MMCMIEYRRPSITSYVTGPKRRSAEKNLRNTGYICRYKNIDLKLVQIKVSIFKIYICRGVNHFNIQISHLSKGFLAEAYEIFDLLKGFLEISKE